MYLEVYIISSSLKIEEIALDAPQMHGKILELNKESKKNRESFETLQAKFGVLKDIEDLEEWKKKADEALEHVANFNEQDWLKADKVAKLKQEMADAYEEKLGNQKKGFETQLVEREGAIGKKDSQIRKLLISNKFATSSLFSGDDPKTTLPPEMAEAYFGKNFKIEEGNEGVLRIIAYDANGDQIISRINVGEPAEFEEAIEAIFDSFPGKDRLLKSKGGGSGGAGGGGGSDGGGIPAGIKKLEEAYAVAEKAGNSKLMISLKNQLFEAKRKANAA